MKAIETKYKGYRFRSRLEVRWAVFFDALGLDWEYELEGFELEGGEWYLPDFKVSSATGCTTWYEVKPKGINNDKKYSLFSGMISYGQGVSANILCGDPVSFFGDDEKFNNAICDACGHIGVCVLSTPELDGSDCFVILCPHCSSPGFEPSCTFTSITGRFNRIYSVDVFGGQVMVDSSFHLDVMKHVWQCAYVARSARFEHGESP